MSWIPAVRSAAAERAEAAIERAWLALVGAIISQAVRDLAEPSQAEEAAEFLASQFVAWVLGRGLMIVELPEGERVARIRAEERARLTALRAEVGRNGAI